MIWSDSNRFPNASWYSSIFTSHLSRFRRQDNDDAAENSPDSGVPDEAGDDNEADATQSNDDTESSEDAAAEGTTEDNTDNQEVVYETGGDEPDDEDTEEAKSEDDHEDHEDHTGHEHENESEGPEPDAENGVATNMISYILMLFAWNILE